jgi:hypothetical protein
MPNAVELFKDGPIPCKASAAVTGGRFVKISATVEATDGNPVVAHAGAGEKVFGVAMHDAAIGAFVTVARPGDVMPVTSGAAVAAGAEVQSDANGKAITLAAGKSAGIAINTVGAADATVYVDQR